MSNQTKLSDLLSSGWEFADVESSLDSHALMLLYLSRYGHMPELYGELGRTAFLQLLQVFGGMELQIPTQAELVRAVAEVHIYSVMRIEPASRTRARELANKYQCSTDDIRRIYLRVQREFQVMDRDGKSLLARRREIEDDHTATGEVDILDVIFGR